jgi:tetratricopeptide (TPR) repeat protein
MTGVRSSKLWVCLLGAGLALDCAGGGAASTTTATTGSLAKASDANASDSDSVETSFAKAMSSFSGKGTPNWSDVASRMQEFVDDHPNYGPAWYNLGVAHQNQGDSQQAEQAYRLALRHQSNLREASENLAASLAKRDESSQAIQVLSELVAKDPGAAKARVSLARIHSRKGEFEEAERLLKEALAYEPKNLDAYCGLADIALKRGKGLRVRMLAAQGLKIEPKTACLYSALGGVALKDGDKAVALASFQKAVEYDPDLIEARFRVAEVSLDFKDFKKAVDNYEAVIQRFPNDVAALVDLGVAYKGLGRFQDAERVYKQAIAASGPVGTPAAHFNLGVLYLRNLGNLDASQAQLRRFLELKEGSTPFEKRASAMLDEIEKMRSVEAQVKSMQAEEVAPEPDEASSLPEPEVEGKPEEPVPPSKASPPTRSAPKSRKKSTSPAKKSGKLELSDDDFE